MNADKFAAFPMYSTPYPSLGFKMVVGGWRFYDVSDKMIHAAVGPLYPSKDALQADMKDYAERAGWAPKSTTHRAVILEITAGTREGFVAKIMESDNEALFSHTTLTHMSVHHLFKVYPKQPADMVGKRIRMTLEVL